MTDIKKDAVWKSYQDYPFIEANQYGQVRTRDRYVKVNGQGKRLIKGRVLKQQLMPNGYMKVNFKVNGKVVNLYVHRIVAICFIPNQNNLPEINHIDNDPTNNTVSNLEWCTHKYNMAYCGKYGKALSCPLIAVNLETSEVLYFKSQSEASRQIGASAGNINNVLKGLYNKTHGYWFCYADENAVGKTRAKFGDEVANEVKKLMSESHN